MKEKSIPGWTIHIDEISNGIFRVRLTDTFGRIAEVVDVASDETIDKAIGAAFDIEKQISKNWNLFLYNLCSEKLGNTHIKAKEYQENSFGSWFIETQTHRLIYDGKDSWLKFQVKSENCWKDIEKLKNSDLKYSHLLEQIKRLTEDNLL